jgi:CysZ protein
MFRSLRAFSQGWGFHVSGIRFGLHHFSFLSLSLLPFVVTLALYIAAFYMFTLYSDDLLTMIWHPNTGETSRYVGWLYWAYTHVVKFLLYVIVLVVMFYTFILLSNVVASPLYDHISAKYERNFEEDVFSEKNDISNRGIWTVIKEELKKAVLMLVLPIPFLFIPAIGPILGFLIAATFIAWDFVDFSLARDCPLLKDRIRTVWRFRGLLLGFGCPLLIPFFGLLIVPFAILGGTKLYFDKIKPELQPPSISPTNVPMGS